MPHTVHTYSEEPREARLARAENSAPGETKARLIEMRFFGGMTPEEISECVSMPVTIVRRELRVAQACLRRQIAE